MKRQESVAAHSTVPDSETSNTGALRGTAAHFPPPSWVTSRSRDDPRRLTAQRLGELYR
jgi:hypothetical protein